MLNKPKILIFIDYFLPGYKAGGPTKSVSNIINSLTNKFDFEIIKSPNLEIESTKVPSMLLQPFLENANLHGILPKQSKGRVSIILDRKGDNRILACISDNGVGRDFHKDKLGKKHNIPKSI
mgnify:CR=1 FL=1